MKNCILCNQLTEGSIGAAGIKWPNICQPCKDIEDAALSAKLSIQAKVTAKIFEIFEGGRNENSAKS